MFVHRQNYERLEKSVCSQYIKRLTRRALSQLKQVQTCQLLEGIFMLAGL